MIIIVPGLAPATFQFNVNPPLSKSITGFLISCCSIALRDQPALEAVKRISEAGFTAIEFLHTHLQGLHGQELAELSKSCLRLNMEVTVVSPYFSFTKGPEKVEESLQNAQAVVAAAKILGAKKIRTFIDVGSNGLPSARAGLDDWKGAGEGLRRLCAIDRSMEFIIETHKNTLADTLSSTKRLLTETEAPNLKINFQANRDFLQRGYLASMQELFPFISHFHWQQVLPDETETYLEEAGLVPFEEVLEFLRLEKYTGTASVEYCWPNVPPERIASACQYLGGIYDNLNRRHPLEE